VLSPRKWRYSLLIFMDWLRLTFGVLLVWEWYAKGFLNVPLGNPTSEKNNRAPNNRVIPAKARIRPFDFYGLALPTSGVPPGLLISDRSYENTVVIPAKAGIHPFDSYRLASPTLRCPAFAGMTREWLIRISLIRN
jgi:hypothetical protein